ncbi:hypothetical protein CCM_03920 [Cordyceps militaris CM01]|uniref:Ilp is an apoptosis inhibitor n=1 Tax=Cordyceps militaris (strain CM01) TaxID=983644 RepID=G3JD72_CORMM|nr:uncharacterized protein CCM_03920 [Cordyceps militaris CM01]EGX92547.1 hypothetical protein CCM_03920 [Cordyceps militaris CM01]
MPTAFQHPFQESQFDLFDWYPKFRECQNHFIRHAQHTAPVQAVAAFVNILLPFQQARSRETAAAEADTRQAGLSIGPVTLVPYVRRLVATGFDTPAVLHGFFGDAWSEGVGQIHEMERRNFLFAAKSDNWVTVKSSYDIAGGQNVPFLRPLQGVTELEIQRAESNWSEWLSMSDWMLGPRALDSGTESK